MTKSRNHKFGQTLGTIFEPTIFVPYLIDHLGFGRRVETFFRQRCGITLGAQPWAIARKQ